MKLKPLGDHIIVKALVDDRVTAAGLVLPDSVDKEKPEKGEVVAVGAGRLLENGTRAAVSVKVGDKVVFKKYSPDEFKINNQTLLILSESDIIAIIEG